MKTAPLLVCSLFVVPRLAEVRPALEQEALPASTGLKEALRRTGDSLRAGRFDEAAKLAEDGYRQAIRVGQPGMAARFLGNRGNAYFSLHQLGSALNSYLEAHALAQSAGEQSIAAALTANIASLYREAGEHDAAGEWLQNAVASLSGNDPALPKVQMQLAAVRARQGRMEEALDLFRACMDAAERTNDAALYTGALHQLGVEYLRARRLPDAERVLLEAWRIRKLGRIPGDAPYFYLAKVWLAQGKLDAARGIADRMVERTGQPAATMPPWDVYHTRARIRLAQGDGVGALADARTALILARAWRWSVPPDDASHVGSEGLLHDVYSGFIEAAEAVARNTGDAAYLGESFAAADENRADSLRGLLAQSPDRNSRLPAEYWRTVSALQNAEVAALNRPGTVTEARLRKLRAELARQEAGLGAVANPQPADLLMRVQAVLDSDTALLAFHAGARRSWVWAVDREGVSLHRLPPARKIERAAAALTTALRSGRGGGAARAEALHATLFGQLDRRIHTRRRWIIAPDGPFYEIPFATLIESKEGVRTYLAQSHTLETIPSATMLLEPAPVAHPGWKFVGMGDPIYSTADPRYRGRAARVSRPPYLRLFAGDNPADAVMLPRLAGSAAEIAACGRVWGWDNVRLFTGAEASPANLEASLRQHPAVIHVASHVLRSAQRSTYGLMALSLGENGLTEVVSPDRVWRWRTDAELVVLSGCSSSIGAALPGTGLLGLTRAWLAAGARHVVASQWATPDDTGALFVSMYRHWMLSPDEGVARALSLAQREMIETGGWRSHPRYWGAFFVVGRAAGAGRQDR